MKKYRMLIVMLPSEDRDLLAKYLPFQGYEVVLAETALAGLAELEQRLPDIMVVEEELGNVDGELWVWEMREKLQYFIPTLFVRSYYPPDIIADYPPRLEDYITTPFDIEELRLRIQILMRNYEQLKHLLPMKK